MTGKTNTSSLRQHHNTFQPSVDTPQSPPVYAASSQICYGLPQDWQTKLSSEIPLAPSECLPSSFWMEQEGKKAFSEPHLNAAAKCKEELQSLELWICFMWLTSWPLKCIRKNWESICWGVLVSLCLDNSPSSNLVLVSEFQWNELV